jgi:HD-like signal output (HDOD) protein/prolyl-tRNA editing enzyme YbaK/EbsC (Cys-tRNA(Pro) deacylase)
MSINNAAINFLMQRAIEYQLIKKKYDGTQPATVREYGINPSLIAQAQLMQDEMGLMLLVYPRNHRLNHDKLQQLLQRQMQPADELITQQLFHCDDISAIAPLPLTTGLRAVVDNTLLQQAMICFEANDNNLLVCLSGQAFMQLHHGSQWAGISDPISEPLAAAAHSASHGKTIGTIADLPQRLLTLRELPPANDLTRALLDIFKNASATVNDLASVIETDASLTAQTLRHARSPYYGYGGEITSVADAINSVLGYDTVLTTSLAIASSGSLQIPREGRLGKEALCRHSLYSAVLAKTLCRYIPKERGVRTGTAYLAALMQNMGFLLLGHLLKPDYQQLCRALEANPDTPLLQLEDKTLGINHTQIGGWLMRSWNMPAELTIALREHHNVLYRGEHATYVQLIALVNILLKQHDIGDASNEAPMDMLLKALNIPQEKAITAVEVLLSQRDRLNQLAASLSA